jgi:hypothetical protein
MAIIWRKAAERGGDTNMRGVMGAVPIYPTRHFKKMLSFFLWIMIYCEEILFCSIVVGVFASPSSSLFTVSADKSS